MAYLGILGAFLELAVVWRTEVSEPEAEILTYAALVFALLIIQYMGSSMVDAIRAWRGTDNGQ
jgi:hypothetical protein